MKERLSKNKDIQEVIISSGNSKGNIDMKGCTELENISDSFKKIVVVKDNIIPWYDEDGIYYVGIEEFLLKTINAM